jgi:NAD(P)H-hydrate epimerase
MENRIIGNALWERAIAQAIDRMSSETYGIHPLVLMEAAGRAVAEFIINNGLNERPILILGGPGNNGGDAFVAARYLADAGCRLSIYLVKEESHALSPSCEAQLRTLSALKIPIHAYTPGNLPQDKHPVIIDGIFGIGFAGKLDPEHIAYKALSEANSREPTTVAIDLPSGLDCDDGSADHVPLAAEVCLSFGGLKPAQVLAPARDLCGQCLSFNIGFPNSAIGESLKEHEPSFVHTSPESLLEFDPWSQLPQSAHKYDRGHVLVIGGSPGKTGAPLLAAKAALRTGAGWVSVAMSEGTKKTISGEVPEELTFEDLFVGDLLNSEKLTTFVKERKVKSIVIGPGSMGSPFNELSWEALAQLIESNVPCVIDAGALHGIAGFLKKRPIKQGQCLLTPHPGEWSKMGFDLPDSPLSPSYVGHAQDVALENGVTLLYKSATPVAITGDNDAPAFVSNVGSNSLARAGSGDVFAGITGAHLAISFNTVTASLRSNVVLALSAQLVGAEKGEQAVTASDIIDKIGLLQEKKLTLFQRDEDED